MGLILWGLQCSAASYIYRLNIVSHKGHQFLLGGCVMLLCTMWGCCVARSLFELLVLPILRSQNVIFLRVGVLLVQVDSHPFDLDKMLFMDWRDSHLRSDKELREGNAKLPTFLYAMPFSANHIFLGSILCSCIDVCNHVHVWKSNACYLLSWGLQWENDQEYKELQHI